MQPSTRSSLRLVAAAAVISLVTFAYRLRRVEAVIVTPDGHRLTSMFSGRPVGSAETRGVNTPADDGFVALVGHTLDRFFGLTTVYAGLGRNCSLSNFSPVEVNCSDVGCSGGMYYGPGLGGGKGGSGNANPCTGCDTLQGYCEATE